MNELATLLPIAPATVGTANVQTVDARKLHAFLEVGKVFPTWITDRIAQYDFQEGVDYVIVEGLSLPESGSAKARPQTRKDYHLTLDTAKEIAMVERNEKGKQARRYFIDCERRLHEAPVSPLIPKTYSEALRLAASQAEIIERQDEALLLAAPKIAALDRISASDGSITITEAAKVVGKPPRQLGLWLSQNGWIFKRPGRDHWEPYQLRITQGYMEAVTVTIPRSSGIDTVKVTPRLLPKGVTRLAEIFAGKEAA